MLADCTIGPTGTEQPGDVYPAQIQLRDPYAVQQQRRLMTHNGATV
jgi:hypothetical protein